MLVTLAQVGQSISGSIELNKDQLYWLASKSWTKNRKGNFRSIQTKVLLLVIGFRSSIFSAALQLVLRCRWKMSSFLNDQILRGKNGR